MKLEIGIGQKGIIAEEATKTNKEIDSGTTDETDHVEAESEHVLTPEKRKRMEDWLNLRAKLVRELIVEDPSTEELRSLRSQIGVFQEALASLRLLGENRDQGGVGRNYPGWIDEDFKLAIKEARRIVNEEFADKPEIAKEILSWT
ncbi:hypothetical protein HN358_00315 [Candidatus Uhrbacteria bacterium]|jgi:hypothetical protein|nr:hypothetical protein [Candidatus Uhrbacteria bacterium]MBT7717714.1 hypothetical protein [Candidatus Uhrbacteria bacterium]